jgi:hypothetical protein
MPEFIPDHTPADLDDFTRGYMECAEWCALVARDDDPEMTDNDRAECIGFDSDAIAQAKADCADFQTSNESDMLTYYELGRDPAHAGHDFYLTRNGAGAGFWDRGDDPVYTRLSDACRPYGSADCMYDTESKTYFFG